MGKYKYDNSKSYDDNLFYYIWEIENPDSVGYDPKTDRWTKPTQKGYDRNQIGIGLDTVTNNEVRNFLQKNRRSYLTTPEVRNFMKSSINYFNGALDRIINNKKISDTKRMAAIGLLYRGDAPSLKKNRNGMMDALLNGSDRDFIDSITNFHNTGKRTERAKRHADFFENYTDNTTQLSNQNNQNYRKYNGQLIKKNNNNSKNYFQSTVFPIFNKYNYQQNYQNDYKLDFNKIFNLNKFFSFLRK